MDPLGGIHTAEVELGKDVALICGLAIPLHRLDVILSHASARFIHLGKVELGIGVALICGLAIPLQRLNVVLGHSQGLAVHKAENVLRLGVALLCKLFQFLERGFIVITVEGGFASGVVCTGRGWNEKQGYKGEEKQSFFDHAHFRVHPPV